MQCLRRGHTCTSQDGKQGKERWDTKFWEIAGGYWNLKTSMDVWNIQKGNNDFYF